MAAVVTEGSNLRSSTSHSLGGSPQPRSYSSSWSEHMADFSEEIQRLAEDKKKRTMIERNPDKWKQELKKKMEDEINRQVQNAFERVSDHDSCSDGELSKTNVEELEQLNAHIFKDLTDKEKEYVKEQRMRRLHARRRFQQFLSDSRYGSKQLSNMHFIFNDELSKSNQDEYPGVFGLHSMSDGLKSYGHYLKIAAKASSNFGSLTNTEKHAFYYIFTKHGFREALRTGRLPDGSQITPLGNGRYVDKYGIIRDVNGPFWPPDYGPLFPAQKHKRICSSNMEPFFGKPPDRGTRNVDNQQTPFTGRWRGLQVVYDSEKSCKDYETQPVSEGVCPSLKFESRFESGNLRQVRRVGQFEYELVLKTDLYTKRHTQWYYFRVQNAQPGITYKFRILNLLKKDSLYNHGMRPLMYSEKLAETKGIGWYRTGHHICYSKNVMNLHCPLLTREMAYFMLEWQMEFPYEDSCYLAHCYPYTFSDLKDDLDSLLSDPTRSKVMHREVMCETRAGNSCFLLTVTNFDDDADVQEDKKGIVVSARVHPGESNSSWMMKGVLDFLTGSSAVAKELRSRYIFKIVPMLNPDGVIVGNYRCSLAARDLNRNYRHPRCESFPTIWHTKAMMERFSQSREILVYCDLHGHSRKHNVFMYGCNRNNANSCDALPAESYLKERLIPYLMSKKAPDKFLFRGCKFQIRRCKESTGRVVMFRQMSVLNSFTLEATFCGTNICRGDKRHFTIVDFQDMGHVFCEVMLEYHKMQFSKTKETEVVRELTTALAHQILQAKGLLPDDIPDLTTEAGKCKLAEYVGEANPQKMSSVDEVHSAVHKLLTKDSPNEAPRLHIEGSNIVMSKSADKQTDRPEIGNLLTSMTMNSIDKCVDLLEQLQVTDKLQESDSSDSDSESEPEMKYTEPKSRRKKKKHKKSKSQQEHRQKESKELRPNTVSALPAIPTPESESGKKKKQNVGMSSYMKKFGKSHPGFVNKYEGRSNGGIPCFSEERLLERANKRMTEMKKKVDDDYERRDDQDDLEYSQLLALQDPGLAVQRARTQADLRKQYQQAIMAVSPNQVKTAYMHGADPVSLPVSFQARPRYPDYS